HPLRYSQPFHRGKGRRRRAVRTARADGGDRGRRVATPQASTARLGGAAGVCGADDERSAWCGARCDTGAAKGL
ncbi:uncharacterized protein METZ01_LOCUS377177, partial [marine metagenome]